MKARPTTFTAPGWTGTAADIADDSDATFVESIASPTPTYTFESLLGALTDPGLHTGHQILLRVALNGEEPLQLTVQLVRVSDGLVIHQGNVLVSSLSVAPITMALTEAEAALILSYAAGALKVRGWAESSQSPSVFYIESSSPARLLGLAAYTPALDIAGNGRGVSDAGCYTYTIGEGSDGGSLPARLAESTGTPYYVDKATGVDSAGRTGLSEAQAWNSLTYALSRIPAPTSVAGGPRILVKAGLYNEYLEIAMTAARAPDATHVLTFEGYGGRPQITWVDGNTRCINLYGNDSTYYARYVRFRNFDLSGYRSDTGHQNGAIIDIEGTAAGYAHHIEFDDCIIHDARPATSAIIAQGVFIGTGCHHIQFWRCKVYDIDTLSAGIPHQSHCFYVQGSYVYLINCLGYNAPNGIAIQFYGGSAHGNCGVYHCTLANSWGGLLVSSSFVNVTVRGCIVAHNSNFQVQGYDDGEIQSNQTVQNCVLHGAQPFFVTGASPLTQSGNVETDPLFTETPPPPAGGGAVYFMWEAVAGATSYVLEVGTAAGLSNIFDSPVGNVLTYPVQLDAGHYFARVRAVIGGVEQPPSADQEVTVA